jgi:hypothetical protein
VQHPQSAGPANNSKGCRAGLPLRHSGVWITGTWGKKPPDVPVGRLTCRRLKKKFERQPAHQPKAPLQTFWSHLVIAPNGPTNQTCQPTSGRLDRPKVLACPSARHTHIQYPDTLASRGEGCTRKISTFSQLRVLGVVRTLCTKS